MLWSVLWVGQLVLKNFFFLFLIFYEDFYILVVKSNNLDIFKLQFSQKLKLMGNGKFNHLMT